MFRDQFGVEALCRERSPTVLPAYPRPFVVATAVTITAYSSEIGVQRCVQVEKWAPVIAALPQFR